MQIGGQEIQSKIESRQRRSCDSLPRFPLLDFPPVAGLRNLPGDEHLEKPQFVLAVGTLVPPLVRRDLGNEEIKYVWLDPSFVTFRTMTLPIVWPSLHPWGASWAILVLRNIPPITVRIILLEFYDVKVQLLSNTGGWFDCYPES